jgi:hypothetical protein
VKERAQRIRAALAGVLACLTFLGLLGFTPNAIEAVSISGVTVSSFVLTLLDDASALAARTTLGVGTGDSPQLTGLELSHATANTLTAASGNLSIEGKLLWRDSETQAIDDSGGAIAWNAAAGRLFTVTLDGNHAFSNPTNLQTGGWYGGVVCMDATGQRSPTWGSTFEAPEIRRAASNCTFVSWLYDGTKLRVKDHAVARGVVFLAGTAIQWTNMPSATTEFNGGTGVRQYVDFSGAQEVRLRVNRSGGTSPPAGSALGVQYSLDDGSSWLAFDGTAAGDLGTIEPQVPIDAVATLKSSWTAIPSAARVTGVLLRIVGDDGNGATSPSFAGCSVDYR